MCGDVEARERIDWVGLSYLAGRDKLQRAQRTLQVGDIVLEVSQRVGDAGLNLGRVLPRRAVGRDLVQRVGHVGG
jgi:hypothetical protein